MRDKERVRVSMNQSPPAAPENPVYENVFKNTLERSHMHGGDYYTICHAHGLIPIYIHPLQCMLADLELAVGIM